MSTTTSPTEEVPAPHQTGIRRLRFLITPKWIALIIGVIAFAMACYLILAPWQFGRNAQRSAQNTAIEAAQRTAPAPIGQIMSTTTQPDQQLTFHRVTVTGTFVPSSEAYVRLRQDANGNPASEVVVTLRTADGTDVLIDRGYVPASSVTAGAELPALPAGTVTVIGRVQQDEVDPAHRPPEPAPDGRLQYYAVNAEQLTGTADVFRGYLQLTEDSPAVLTAIGMPQIDSGPFLSYALQWLAFGAIAVFGIGFFIHRELTDPVEDIYLPEEDPEPAANPATTPGPGRSVAEGVSKPGVSPPGGPVDPVPVAATPMAARRKRWDRTELYDPE